MPSRPFVVVIGGANIDVKARSRRRAVAATSNPGHTVLSAGGVGRNVAENLARLGTRTHLVAAVGSDPWGELVLSATAAAGVEVAHVHRVAEATGTYTAVLDADGELVLAVADMAATEALAPEHVDDAAVLVAEAGLLVLDGNLAPPTLARALDVAAAAGVRVVLEPVSVPKAAALAPTLAGRALFAVTPNADELETLAAGGGAAALHAGGVEYVWVRRGVRGSFLSTADGTHQLAAVPVPPDDVVDVTGAGDAMLAAFCHLLLSGSTPQEAATGGHAAAALTVTSEDTVRPDLTDRLLRSLL